MLRSDLVALLEDCCDLDHATADDVLTVVLDAIVEALHDGDSVSLLSFGKFETKRREGHEGRNPATGQKVWVDSKYVVKFTPGSSMQRALDDMSS